jgi:hypothetical protein
MRKLVFILLAFIAAAAFIRAYDNDNGIAPSRPLAVNSEIVN